MPGSIVPLPVMLEEEDRKAYEQLKPPSSMVVRYGYQRMIAELPYDGSAKPGCGSKLVAITPRGTEVVEMLTTTCGNSGCGKSVSRDQMLKYIENSGGKQFPFTTRGKILRVASLEDLNEQARLEARRPDMIRLCNALINELDLDMKLVEVETILGDEQVSFYFLAEDRVDFRELVRRLASELQTRIEMVHVNDREEARLVADYEKCGQHCCCRQFLKVLKPVSMRSAKVQKNTLDPQKISGRCGRLMCCLRYEDQTYSDLKKQLPHRKTLVETEDGVGIVLNSQILTQLVLVKVGRTPPAAYPLETIRRLTKEEAKAWAQEHGDPTKPRDDREDAGGRPPRGRGRGPRNESKKPAAEPRRPKPGQPLGEHEVQSKEGNASASLSDTPPPDTTGNPNPADGDKPKRKRRRRRKRKGGGDNGPPPTRQG
ncbi:MAG: regulatory iron-sulfur-containing complex subunit RicT [Planctomycetota bacterium]